MEKKLNEIAEVFSGVRLSRFNEGNTELQPVLERKRLNNEEDINFSFEKVSKDLDKKFYSKKDDIVVLLAVPNTISKINEEGIIIPMQYAVIRVKDEYDSNLIYYLLKNKIFLREVNKLNEGSVLKFIRTKSLKEIKIPIFEKDTQKYSELLKLIDKKISLRKEAIKLDEQMKNSILNIIMEDN